MEKALERGLTLPYRGGAVRLKSMVDSLQHACKVIPRAFKIKSTHRTKKKMCFHDYSV